MVILVIRLRVFRFFASHFTLIWEGKLQNYHGSFELNFHNFSPANHETFFFLSLFPQEKCTSNEEALNVSRNDHFMIMSLKLLRAIKMLLSGQSRDNQVFHVKDWLAPTLWLLREIDETRQSETHRTVNYCTDFSSSLYGEFNFPTLPQLI